MSVSAQTRYLSHQQFDTLLRPVRPALLRFAVRRVGLANAEDCVQQGTLAAWDSRDRLPLGFGGTDFARFCARRVAWACRAHLRRVSSQCEGTHFTPDALLLAVETSDAMSTLALPSLQCALYDALRDELTALLLRVPLTPLQELCVRRWIEGETLKQIADDLGVSFPMVSQHIQAAVKKLRAEREKSEEHLDTNIAYFFHSCIADVKRTIYRKPSHGSAPRTAERRRRSSQRTDKPLPRADRTALEQWQWEINATLGAEEGVAA